MNIRCPGQDKRFWKPEDIFESECPICAQQIEFWKDDIRVKCPGCGQMIQNPKLDLGCAKWCDSVAACLGLEGDKIKTESICDKLVYEMNKVFGEDQHRISHALSVLRYAEEILEKEKADPLVVKAAAILHDIGIKEAEKKYGSSAGKYQEIEGPPIAKKIMEEINIPEPAIDHVCKIIANHHSARDIDTKEFRILWDADWLVNIPEEYKGVDKERLKNIIDKVFKTKTGKEKAYKLFVDAPL